MRELSRTAVWLFAADEADAGGEGEALAAGEGAEASLSDGAGARKSVDIVDDGVGILAVESVHRFDAGGPEVAAETELFLEADIEAGIPREARGVGQADELLLKIDDAEGVAGAVLEEIAEFDAPDMRGSPAPGEEAVGRVPCDGTGLLGDVENGAESGIEDFVGMREGARVRSVDFHFFGKNVAEGDGGGAIAVFASALQEESAARLRGLLIDVGEAVSAVAGEEIEGEERIVGELLLPACAAGGEARLLEAVRGQKELADYGAWSEDGAGGVIEGVDLLLVESLADEREIERRVVDAPAEGNFRGVAAEGEDVGGDAGASHGALRKAIPIGAQAGLQDEILRGRPSVLHVGACLGVRNVRICGTGKSGEADEATGLKRGGAGRGVGGQDIESLDFAAVSEERVGEVGYVGADGELMSAMPVARRGDHLGESLEAAAALIRALKIISCGAIDEEEVGLRALGDVIEDALVSGDANFEERVVEPDLVFERGEVAALIGGYGGGDRVEGVEAEIGDAGVVVEKAGVENVLGSEIVLEAEKIVASPLLPSVSAGGLLFNDSEDVLKADGIGKPKAAAPDGAGESEARIPVAEMEAFLKVDAGSGIGGAEAPAIVAIGSFEVEDIRAGMSVASAEIAGLDFGGACGVDIEARGELAVDGVTDFEAVEKILGFAGAGAGNVQIVGIVLGDFRECN